MLWAHLQQARQDGPEPSIQHRRPLPPVAAHWILFSGLARTKVGEVEPVRAQRLVSFAFLDTVAADQSPVNPGTRADVLVSKSLEQLSASFYAGGVLVVVGVQWSKLL